jgi:hypothetical protein
MARDLKLGMKIKINPGDDTNKNTPNFLESVSHCNNFSYLLYVPF